jgi:hypothetical protein
LVGTSCNSPYKKAGREHDHPLLLDFNPRRNHNSREGAGGRDGSYAGKEARGVGANTVGDISLHELLCMRCKLEGYSVYFV